MEQAVFIFMGIVIAVWIFLRAVPFIVRKMRGKVNYITPQDLKKKLDAGEDWLILDVRSAIEFNSTLGHIPDSINIPFSMLAERLDETESRLKDFSELPVATLCFRDGSSGFQAYNMLLNKGFTNVFLLDKGITGWIQSGYRVIVNEQEIGRPA